MQSLRWFLVSVPLRQLHFYCTAVVICYSRDARSFQFRRMKTYLEALVVQLGFISTRITTKASSPRCSGLLLQPSSLHCANCVGYIACAGRSGPPPLVTTEQALGVVIRSLFSFVVPAVGIFGAWRNYQT